MAGVLVAIVFGFLTLFPTEARATINIFSSGTATNIFTVSDDFSSDSFIDQPLSRYLIQDGKLYAENGSVSSRIVSQAVAYSSYNIGSAKLVVSDYTPAGSRIVYFLSNDNGQTWIQAQLNIFVNFNSTGKTLQWSAAISKQSPSDPGPFIDSLTITYKYGYDTNLYAANDSQRISDLSTVANALNNFYRDYGIYPHVSGSRAESNWNELMTLLSRNKRGGLESYPYLWTLVNDPLYDSEERTTYDYKDLSSNEYILAARLELTGNYALTNDLDGTYGGINCDDPVYCIGVAHGPYYSSGSQVLGASTTSTTYSRTYTSVSPGLDLESMIATPLNELLGYEAFRFGSYIGPGYTTETRTATQNYSSSTGNSGTVAGASIAKVAGVTTGTAGSLIMSLLLSTLITYGYMNYTKTGLFKKREALAVIKEHRLDKNKFNFVN